MKIEKHEAMQRCYQIPGMLWPSEQAWLYDVFRESRNHAEVGTYCGKSLYISCAGMKHRCNVIAIDAFVETSISPIWCEDVCRATIQEINDTTNAIASLVRDDTYRASQSYTGPKLDSVFIDAAHHYAECKRDIETWTRHVRPGGLVCGHDYWTGHIGVMDAVNETGPFEVVPNTRIWWRRV